FFQNEVVRESVAYLTPPDFGPLQSVLGRPAPRGAAESCRRGPHFRLEMPGDRGANLRGQRHFFAVFLAVEGRRYLAAFPVRVAAEEGDDPAPEAVGIGGEIVEEEQSELPVR